MQKKINIVHLIPAISFGGGAENVLYHLLRTIDRSRFQMTVLYWGPNDDMAADLRDMGVKVIKLSFKRVISVDSVLEIARAVKAVKGDLLHTHFMDADLLGFLTTRWIRIPLIAQIHSFPFPVCKRHAWRYWWMSLGISRIISVSQTVKKYIVSKTGIGEERFRVVYNGIDLKVFDQRVQKADRAALRQAFKISEDDRVIGNVSRLIPDKGQEFLIRAMPVICQAFPVVKLLIVGDGPLRAGLEHLACSLGVAERIIFAGKRRDVPELLSIMDFFVFPTFHEAFGICVLEAMAAGIPIIATDDAAIPEIITHGENGWLVSPGSSEQIGEALKRLLSNAELSRRLAANARERVKAFSLEQMRVVYEQVYRESVH